MSNSDEQKKALKAAYLIYPHWGTAFFVMGGVILLVIGVSVRFLLGFSAASDVVFSIEALFSGLGVDFVFRRWFGRKLVAAPKVEIPLVYLWPALCLYVMIARPFE